MTRFTDGKSILEIRMRTWDKYNGGYTPDWEQDFFTVGRLKYDEERNEYHVEDVRYLIAEAKSWAEIDENYIVDYDIF